MMFSKLLAFASLFGTVENDAILAGLKLMLFGMLGIFVAMGLIFGAIAALNALFKDKKDSKSDLKG